MHDFDLHLSLGRSCATRYQIERKLTNRHGHYPQKTFFFDWLWRNNGFSANILAFNNDFSISESDLCLGSISSHYEVYHRIYGLHFLHDFSLSKIEHPKEIEDLEKSMKAETKDFLEKYRHIAKSTIEALRNAQKPALYFAGDITISEFQEFMQILSSKYSRNFTLIHLPDSSKGQKSINHPAVISRAFDQTSSVWSGVDSEWDTALEGLI